MKTTPDIDAHPLKTKPQAAAKRPVLPIPVRFIGVGEGLDDLRPFVAEDFVEALLGLDE